MKAYSKNWKASKKPAKQRKYQLNAPIHLKRKMVKSPLSKELKEQHKINAAVIRTGDTVKIMRGDHKGKSGKVIGFGLKDRTRVLVQGIEVTRLDGSKKNVPLVASNLMITRMEEDKRRINKSKEKEEKKAAPKQAKPKKTAKKTAKKAGRKSVKKPAKSAAKKSESSNTESKKVTKSEDKSQ